MPTEIILPEIEIKNRGMFVEVMQVLLKYHGYKIAVDGAFGLETYNALRDFKQQNYLSGDTVTDADTWLKLFTE